jgi:hypothetical protein
MLAALDEFGFVELREILVDLVRGGSEVRAAIRPSHPCPTTPMLCWRAGALAWRQGAARRSSR